MVVKRVTVVLVLLGIFVAVGERNYDSDEREEDEQF